MEGKKRLQHQEVGIPFHFEELLEVVGNLKQDSLTISFIERETTKGGVREGEKR